jgi:hypothetical protein
MPARMNPTSQMQRVKIRKTWDMEYTLVVALPL